MYDGLYHTSRGDIERILEPSYHNDYLWEGINPYTNQRIIVDGSTAKSGYRPMINDGFFKYEPNVTLEFGNDNKIYVVAISLIEAHNEFFFPYGAEYWMDPHRWSSSIATYNSASTEHTLRREYSHSNLRNPHLTSFDSQNPRQ